MTAKKKALLIVAIIFFYFVFLTFVSHARAPVQYGPDLEAPPIASTGDFEVLSAPETVSLEDRSIVLCNPEESVAAIGTRLNLSDLQKVYVEFSVNCPADCVGTVLVVDLFDGDAGYDAPEQEFSTMLRVGVNKIGQVIDKGVNAPEEAWLRIFTTQRATFEIEDVVVSRGVEKQ